MDVAAFKRLPILGILRGIEAEDLEPLIGAVISAGLKTIEITMNTPGAPALIRRARELSAGRLTVGAGTVLDMESLMQALESGATFIVMPTVVEDVLRYCRERKIPVFPGALSPQEIWRAWQAGATMVKVFPAKFFGPEYFQEIKGPFDTIELLACGGVTPENMGSYFSCGTSAVSFGASVFRRQWLQGKDFGSIAGSIRRYIQAWARIQSGSSCIDA